MLESVTVSLIVLQLLLFQNKMEKKKKCHGEVTRIHSFTQSCVRQRFNINKYWRHSGHHQDPGGRTVNKTALLPVCTRFSTCRQGPGLVETVSQCDVPARSSA